MRGSAPSNSVESLRVGQNAVQVIVGPPSLPPLNPQSDIKCVQSTQNGLPASLELVRYLPRLKKRNILYYISVTWPVSHSYGPGLPVATYSFRMEAKFRISARECSCGTAPSCFSKIAETVFSTEHVIRFPAVFR